MYVRAESQCILETVSQDPKTTVCNKRLSEFSDISNAHFSPLMYWNKDSSELTEHGKH